MPSIEAAARLAASNAQLRASLRAEAVALQASRRMLRRQIFPLYFAFFSIIIALSDMK